MATRRHVLQGMAGFVGTAGLQGCGELGELTTFFQPDLAAGTIDIHSHFFNGRDVPVVGFIQQTILRDPHGPADPSFFSSAFLKLMKTILLTNTPTAKAELASIVAGDDPQDPATLERQDQANVTAALADFAAGAAPDTQGFSVTRSEEAQLLDRIAQDVQQEALRQGFQTPRQQAQTLGAEIYARGSATGLETDAGTDREYRHLSPLLQTIRWAGLLTRARRDILAELINLYGGAAQVRVFSPSIVDFTYWFKTDETDVETIPDQIDVVSAIAARSRDALIMPFCPFDPLRAAIEREIRPDLDPLRMIKYAVLNKGFAGVKLYPPMGFKPWGNAGISFASAKRAPRGGGAALDRELAEFYAWCVAEDVPIKSHTNNSIAAGQNTGLYASPTGWQKVLEQPEFSTLRLNLAHFGGFDESRDGDTDWEEIIAEMVDVHDGVFFDIGYWDATTDPDAAHRQRSLDRMQALLGRVPTLKGRMMYGSDWSMIGRVPGHQTYSADTVAALRGIGLTGAEMADVMANNAARFLGMQPGSKQRARQRAFHAANPIFTEVFGI